jgi:hypothetical protein
LSDYFIVFVLLILPVNTSLRVLQIKGNPIAASNRLVANVLPGLLELDGENGLKFSRSVICVW